MHAHYLQHVPFEGLGSIEVWLREKGYEISATRFFMGQSLPSPTSVDLLIVLGGPMSVNDEKVFPWLTREKEFIRQCIQSEKPILGICLGAQLIANAMGARVYRNHDAEIGWFPVQGLSHHDDSCFTFPPVFEAFHWHSETFDLPVGATHLARTEACENQAFQLGRHVIGLQFHLEATVESVQEILSHSQTDVSPARYVQPANVMLAAAREKHQAANVLMNRVLSFLTGHSSLTST